MKPTIETVEELRNAFWESHPHLVCKRDAHGCPKTQNEQPCDTRCAFVDYVDMMARDGSISAELAHEATL